MSVDEALTEPGGKPLIIRRNKTKHTVLYCSPATLENFIAIGKEDIIVLETTW